MQLSGSSLRDYLRRHLHPLRSVPIDVEFVLWNAIKTLNGYIDARTALLMLTAEVRNLIFTISVSGDEQFIRKILSGCPSFVARSTTLKRSTSRIFAGPSFSCASRVRSLDPAYLEQVLCTESTTNQLTEDVTRTARLKFYMLIILERRPNDKRINMDATESFKRL